MIADVLVLGQGLFRRVTNDSTIGTNYLGCIEVEVDRECESIRPQQQKQIALHNLVL